MMQKMKTLLMALFSVMAFPSAAQENLPPSATWKDSARFYIRQLKDGAVVVRLHTRSMAIQQMRTAGDNQYATAIATVQREENRQIVEAFRTAFTFCKVYFFFADSTDALLQGKRTGFFVNDSLKIDPAIRLTENFFMVADNGNPNLKQKTYDPTQPNMSYTEPSYVNETIFLMDQNLKPLKSPFPRYGKGKFGDGSAHNYWTGNVRSLNSKLHSYFDKYY